MAQKVKQGIGKRIEGLRKREKLSQDELAKKLNMNRSSLNMWELGERELKAGDLQDIADFFGVTTDYLIYGREAPNIDIYRATGLSQEAIEMLKSVKRVSDAFNEANTLGTCDYLSIALSSFDFISSVVRFLSAKSGEPGIDHSAIYNDERKIYECRFSPDMYAAAMAARLSMVLESLRSGKGGALLPYAPTEKERDETFQMIMRNIQMKGAQDGEESK